jgi:hypothetical protein
MPRIIVLMSFFLLLFGPLVQAKGKGPIGIWAASERYVLIADSSLPGLMLIDVEKGVATERLVMARDNPTCVASCPDCNFALMTGTGGDTWKIHFKKTIKQLLGEQGKEEAGRANYRLKRFL